MRLLGRTRLLERHLQGFSEATMLRLAREAHDQPSRDALNSPLVSARPQYPDDPTQRWQVAGSVPINRALFEARGQWIAYMDDDDEMVPTG